MCLEISYFLQGGIGCSSASDTGGVTANVSLPYLSSPDGYFFLSSQLQEIGEGEVGGNRWLVKLVSVMFQPRQGRGRA